MPEKEKKSPKTDRTDYFRAVPEDFDFHPDESKE